MAVPDLTTPEGRIRMAIGDTTDWPVLTDQQITDVLASVDSNEDKATRLCANYVLAALSTRTDYRVDRISILGSGDVFKNYLKYLQYTINSPTSALNAVQIYAAGVDSEDYYNNLLDDTVLHRRPTNPYSYIKGLWNP